MQYIYSDALEVQLPRILPNGHGPYSVFPAVLIGLFGVGAVERAYADAEEVSIIYTSGASLDQRYV